MIKTLILPCLAILIICATLGTWLNYQIPSPAKKQREPLDFLSEQKIQVNWTNALSQLPQYKKPDQAKSAPEIVREQQISDSQIIGIVVDNHKSALLLTDNNNKSSPQQFNIGDGWLKNWKVQSIEPDSITWVNTLTQQHYIQTLFASVDDKSKDSPQNTGTQ
jgi:hypothetical protein